ncbi:hypothetical protein Hden_1100 [Hyphomicrobium denitrificans ATCC 51888]|uniref:Uncharacterized protein n=1 Tax=Hyphomicrobium denitrificans (strain ATCC 51888 / DSM 1869 / NCIMB 11706 / TK 0415) TaxID=582899 RepID=D8JVM5_HYPDA|nr:hypothetical protein [Hyphomicrobium denitrificans]ADJ22914.1 hypothetical protein Hden_1100 [Hyphomicrobium denitrificans ATCC 51888]
MATIVEFRSTSRRTESLVNSGPVNAGGSADIVFFPGVRYERPEEPAAEKPKKSKPCRDTLDIDS